MQLLAGTVNKQDKDYLGLFVLGEISLLAPQTLLFNMKRHQVAKAGALETGFQGFKRTSTTRLDSHAACSDRWHDLNNL